LTSSETGPGGGPPARARRVMNLSGLYLATGQLRAGVPLHRTPLQPDSSVRGDTIPALRVPPIRRTRKSYGHLGHAGNSRPGRFVGDPRRTAEGISSPSGRGTLIRRPSDHAGRVIGSLRQERRCACSDRSFFGQRIRRSNGAEGHQGQPDPALLLLVAAGSGTSTVSRTTTSTFSCLLNRGVRRAGEPTTTCSATSWHTTIPETPLLGAGRAKWGCSRRLAGASACECKFNPGFKIAQFGYARSGCA
jgi:hypothetical protein